MGAPKKADWREERRKRAWNLKEQGWKQKDIAVALGVSGGAVSKWLKRGREQGVEALNAHPPEGMKPRLTVEQKAQIPQLLARGAEAYGFRGDVWTARRVAKVIDQTDRESTTIAITWDACCARRVGVGNNRLNERRNATSKPSKTGMRSDGLPLKKSPRGATDDHLGRRSWVLSLADGGAHLGTTRSDAGAAGAADARSPLGDQWHHPRWPLVSASASGFL